MARKKKISQQDLATAEDIQTKEVTQTAETTETTPVQETSKETIEDKVNQWKEQYDPEVRRSIRKVWIGISVATLLLGYFLGTLFN